MYKGTHCNLKGQFGNKSEVAWTIFSKHLSNIVHPISIGVHVTRILRIIGQKHDEQCILQEIKKVEVKESNYGMNFYHLLNDFCPNINRWVSEDRILQVNIVLTTTFLK